MKKAVIFSVSLLLFFITSCAGTPNYPINLSYTPTKQYKKTGKGTIAVAMLEDKRAVNNKRIIGIKDNESQFISLIGDPADAFTAAFKTILLEKGYAVNKLNVFWDGAVQTIKPSWGDVLIGGYLEDFSISAKSSGFLKTEYICLIKFYLIIADANSLEIKHRERFEVSTSYVTINFSREKAEELINSAMSDTIERVLAVTEKYLP